jgi:hypothetical protein
LNPLIAISSQVILSKAVRSYPDKIHFITPFEKNGMVKDAGLFGMVVFDPRHGSIVGLAGCAESRI